MSEHIVSRKLYFTIFIALMVLTALTVWVANFDLGKWNAIVALTIAVTKGLLVVLYFHARALQFAFNYGLCRSRVRLADHHGCFDIERLYDETLDSGYSMTRALK